MIMVLTLMLLPLLNRLVFTIDVAPIMGIRLRIKSTISARALAVLASNGIRTASTVYGWRYYGSRMIRTVIRPSLHNRNYSRSGRSVYEFHLPVWLQKQSSQRRLHRSV